MSRPLTGQIDRLSSGKYRARLTAGGKRWPLGVCDTEDEARELCTSAIRQYREGGYKPHSGLTVGALVFEWLDARAQDGFRGMDALRRTGRHHIADEDIGGKDARRLTTADVIRWRDALAVKRTRDHRAPRPLSRSVRKSALWILRAALDRALEQGRIATNPAAGIRLKRQPRAESLAVAWTWLTADEREALRTCAAIPLPIRCMVEVITDACVRPGEAACLELRDVDAESNPASLFVRWGSPGRKPKGGVERTVYLTDRGANALREWLALLPTYAKRNPLGLLFPGEYGARRQKGRLILHWTDYLRAAGITRRVRWHDLRHTGATHFYAGIGCDPWPLERIRDHLGHSTVAMTQKYAHAAAEALRLAALRRVSPTKAPRARNHAETAASSACVTSTSSYAFRVIPGASAASWVESAAPRAEAVARAIARHRPDDARAWRELATAVLAADPLTALAMDIRDGLPTRDMAARLAAMVLDATRSSQKRGAK